jgi:hypothetical protein
MFIACGTFFDTRRVPRGGVAEWFKAAVLKTAVPETVPWVRIPPSPPTTRNPREALWSAVSSLPLSVA